MNKEIAKARENYVTKSNEIIQKSRYSLNLREQKLVLYLISMIKPNDTEFHEFEISVKRFCDICGIDERSGKNMSGIKESIKTLADKSMWIQKSEKNQTLVRWIAKATINIGSDIIVIRLDDDLKPYLLQLKNNFAQYQLLNIVTLKSKYAVRLYELMESVHYNEFKPFTYEFPSVEQLTKQLDAENYKRYADVKRRVLLPAIEEINESTDKLLSFAERKRGRQVTGIQLTIETKNTIDRLNTYSKISV